MKRIGIAVAVLAAVAALVAALGWPGPGAGPEPAVAVAGAGVAGEADSAAPAALDPGAAAAFAPEPLPADEAALIGHLRERFGPHLSSRRAQIHLLEKIMRYLQQTYPDDWRSRVRGLLERAFPELAAELFARFERLEAHTRWLEDNRRALGAMPAAQRREVLWAARYQAFGAEADEIWAGERRAEQVQDSLAALDAGGGSVPAKLERFTAALEAAYGEQAPQLIGQRGPELLGRFLAVESVQAQLRSMPPAERRATLRAVRAGLGMDEAALARWDELDRSRDAAWTLGERYMGERATILAVGAAETQARQLQDLRERLFGADEAAVMAGEEAAGFLRYGQPRRIGRE